MQISVGQKIVITGRPDRSTRPGVKIVKVGNCDVTALVENTLPNLAGIITTTVTVTHITGGVASVPCTALMNALSRYAGHAAMP
ncbi:MAG: hypothetical protein ACRC9R_04780 [Enterovibrio sp.]